MYRSTDPLDKPVFFTHIQDKTPDSAAIAKAEGLQVFKHKDGKYRSGFKDFDKSVKSKIPYGQASSDEAHELRKAVEGKQYHYQNVAVNPDAPNAVVTEFPGKHQTYREAKESRNKIQKFVDGRGKRDQKIKTRLIIHD